MHFRVRKKVVIASKLYKHSRYFPQFSYFAVIHSATCNDNLPVGIVKYQRHITCHKLSSVIFFSMPMIHEGSQK